MPASRENHMTIYRLELCFSTRCAEAEREMASKAYVASMTVTELKQELKQRGLSTRGSKKSLRDRLERVRAIFFAPPQTNACPLTRTTS